MLGIPKDDRRKNHQSDKKGQVRLLPPEPISSFRGGQEKKKNTGSQENHRVFAEQAQPQGDPG